MEETIKAVEPAYLITANGIYRCVKLLTGIEPLEKPEYKRKYSYNAIRQWLRTNYATIYRETGYGIYATYNGQYLWEHYFMKDPFLRERIVKKGSQALNNYTGMLTMQPMVEEGKQDG